MAVFSIRFVSRNKDNKSIPDFKQRKWDFLVDGHKMLSVAESKWEDFLAQAKSGEMCRFYISVNARDMEKTRKELACRLILEENFDLTKIEQKTVSIANEPQNALTKKWLFDFDSDSAETLQCFCEEIKKDTEIESVTKTVSGYAIVVSHGFDTRELLKKYPFVELKRDDMKLHKYQKKA